MFVSSERRGAPSHGEFRSGVWSEENAAAFEVVGGVFHGAVRELEFHEDGDLLVVSGLGVRRFDADTFEEREAWLERVHVRCIRRCDARLWVMVGGEIFLAEYGQPLGEPLATVDSGFYDTFTSGGDRFAAPEPLGVCVVDADGTVRRFTFDEAWFAEVWAQKRPDRAMLSPDGAYVSASNGFSSYTVIWDVGSGEEVGASTSYESMAVLDDGRIIKADESSSSQYDLRDGLWSTIDGASNMSDAFVRGGRLLGANADGGHVLLDALSLEVLGEAKGLPHSYGRMSGQVSAAVSSTHVATYAAKQGTLIVSSASGTVESRGWHGAADALSVSHDGSRLAVWRTWSQGRLDCVDVAAAELFEVTDEAGQGVTNACITGDGEHVVAPCGSILRARTVAVGAFGGDTSEDLQKIKSCVHQTTPYGQEHYAIATYTLSGAGLVGLYKAGSKRAVAKLTHQKEQARMVAVGSSQRELLVAWDSVTILYAMTKRPRPVETLSFPCRAIALGPEGFMAYQRSGSDVRELVIRTPDHPDAVVTLDRGATYEYEQLEFSADGALLYVGAPDGTLEVRWSTDGEVLATRQLHAGAFLDVLTRGDTVWTMGKDGVVHVLGVPA